jgi:N-acetylglutamate synthase-like GNAT family acetyltransferase
MPRNISDNQAERMSAAEFRVRRATLEDIGALSALWAGMRFQVEDLAKRITEFQVAETAEGQIIGALGLQILERQGSLHSEAFTDFALADRVRPLLWDRMNALAANHGLIRLWTQEQAPFWRQCGLAIPDDDALKVLPKPWRAASSAYWLTLKLREDLETLMRADHEFALFMQSEKARTQRSLQHARLLKLVATLLALALFIAVLLGAIFVFKNSSRLLGR